MMAKAVEVGGKRVCVSKAERNRAKINKVEREKERKNLNEIRDSVCLSKHGRESAREKVLMRHERAREIRGLKKARMTVMFGDEIGKYNRYRIDRSNDIYMRY